MLGLGCARPSITTCACDDGHRNYHGSGRREPVATNRPAAPTSPYRPNHSAINARERGRASAPASTCKALDQFMRALRIGPRLRGTHVPLAPSEFACCLQQWTALRR